MGTCSNPHQFGVDKVHSLPAGQVISLDVLVEFVSFLCMQLGLVETVTLLFGLLRHELIQQIVLFRFELGNIGAQ